MACAHHVACRRAPTTWRAVHVAPHPQVKQADTILLSYPLGVEMPATLLANDLAFYDPITDPNGPAMTWSMCVASHPRP